MSYDRNPSFGKDQSYSEGARRVTDFLWENSNGDLSSFPRSYLETLRYEFSDGRVSMLELIDRVDLGPDASYEDYCEVVDALMYTEADKWPDPESVLAVSPSRLQHEVEPEFAEFSDDEFEFAEEADMGKKIETFLKKVIGTVYLDGVDRVTDSKGKPPSEGNNFLMSDDGKEFSGIFFDVLPDKKIKKFPFTISEKGEGQWSIAY